MMIPRYPDNRVNDERYSVLMITVGRTALLEISHFSAISCADPGVVETFPLLYEPLCDTSDCYHPS